MSAIEKEIEEINNMIRMCSYQDGSYDFSTFAADFLTRMKARELAISKHLAFQLGYPEEEIIKYIEMVD